MNKNHINIQYLELKRRLQNYSITKLCREANITNGTYYNLVNNTNKKYIKTTTIINIAKVLELDLNTLFGIPQQMGEMNL